VLRPERIREFRRLLGERVLVLDGAMGTVIQSYKLEETDYRGERFRDWPRDLKGNNDLLVLTRPDVIGEIHLSDGTPLDFSQGRLLGNGRGIVCTNGTIHDRVLEACRAELGLQR